VLIGAWPVIIANFVTLVLAGWILGLKLWLQHRRRPHLVPPK
jgi:hypothetical protein